MDRLTLGIVGTSRKENERRLPLHPAHVGDLAEDVRERTYFETGYGERFAVPDAEIARRAAGVRPREELVAECDVVLLPKPVISDLELMAPGQVLCGWVHCVQDPEMTQAAIDRRLTLIAWEAMNHWTTDGSFGLHVFHKNNELAGYARSCTRCSSWADRGSTGAGCGAPLSGSAPPGRARYGPFVRLASSDVSVLTQRDATAVADRRSTRSGWSPTRTDPEHRRPDLEWTAEHETIA